MRFVEEEGALEVVGGRVRTDWRVWFEAAEWVRRWVGGEAPVAMEKERLGCGG